MTSSNRLRVALCVAVMLAAAPSPAFKLAPTTKEPDAESRRLGLGTLTKVVETPLVKVYVDQFSTPVHEDLTHRAYGCAGGHERCKDKDGAPRAVIEGAQWNDNPPFSYRRLRLTVPPTCMGVTIQLPNLHPTCWTTIFASAAGAATTARGLAFGPDDTLLERSHFGDLQFLHAMAASDGEAPQVTRGNILAWAKFAYLVSVGDIPSDAVISDGNAIGSIASFFPAQHDSVLTLFTKGTEPHSDERVRDIAFGSLLHLVQDSFSTSHLQREGPRAAGSEAPPGRIVQFHSYAHQDRYVHAKRDALEALEQNTAESNLLTAIGIRLVALRARKAPFDEVQRVFDSLFELSGQALPAGPGADFEIKPATKDPSPGS